MNKGVKLTILDWILFIVGFVLVIASEYMMVEAVYGYGAMDFWMVGFGCGGVVTIVGMAIILRKGVRVHIVKEDEK